MTIEWGFGKRGSKKLVQSYLTLFSPYFATRICEGEKSGEVWGSLGKKWSQGAEEKKDVNVKEMQAVTSIVCSIFLTEMWES